MRHAYLGLTILVAASAPALADDKANAKAKALYEQGLRAYNIAEYQDAIKAWKEAYSLTKRPLLLFNIGQAYRLDGDCKKALTFYDTYQREEPAPKNQDELDAALALCAKQPDKPIDKPIEKPTEKPVEKPVQTPVETVGQPADGAGAAAPQPPVDDGPDETSSGGGLRKIGIGVGAAGVLLGGVAVYFALDSSSAASDLDGYAGEWGSEQMDLETRGERSAKLGWIFGGVGIAAIVAGGVMYAIGGPKATAEASSVAVVPTRGGASVGWSFVW